MENYDEENGLTDSFGTGYICFCNHIWIFISGRILERLFPNSIYFLCSACNLLRIWHLKQKLISLFFLKFPIYSDVYIGLLICLPHFISLLSLHVSILTLFSTNVLPRYVLGYWYCHPSPEYTTRIMYWFWRGNFEYVRCPYIK